MNKNGNYSIFFTNGLSVIETLGYMLYMICSIDKPKYFKVITQENLKSIVLNNTILKLNNKFYSVKKITKELGELINSQEYKDWIEVRNVLMHRETPGRIINVGTRRAEKERSDLWFKEITIVAKTTVRRLKWLELNLFKLIELTYDFINKLI